MVALAERLDQLAGRRVVAAADRATLRRVALSLSFLFCAVLAQLLRTPGVPPWRSLLAEDGGIFYTDALNRPLLGAVTRPYEGYLHVVPRLLAEVAAVFPVATAAVVLNGGAALVVAALALYVWSTASPVLPSRFARGLLTAAIIALPAAAFEVNASVNNLHWYLDFACLWVFLAPPRGRGAACAGAVTAAAAALSDPLTAMLIPLAGYRLWEARRAAERPPWRLAPPVAFATCLALQLLYGVAERAPQSFVRVDWRDLPGTYGLRVAGSLLIGDRFTPGLFHRYGLAVAFGCLAVAVAAAAAALLVTRGRLRADIAVIFTYSVAFLTIPLLIRGTAIFLDQDRVTLQGSRYMLVPALLLLAGVLAAVFGQPPASRARERPGSTGRARRAARVAAVTVVGAVLVLNFRMASVRSSGPEWRDGVAAARARCLARGGDPPGSVTSAPNLWATAVGPGQVAIPGAHGQGVVSSWNVIVSCDRMAGRPVSASSGPTRSHQK